MAQRTERRKVDLFQLEAQWFFVHSDQSDMARVLLGCAWAVDAARERPGH